MAMEHGVYINEIENNIPVAKEAVGGALVVFGTAPVHLTEDPGAAVNKPVLCRSITEARKQLGYNEDFEKYTLCQSMKMNFLEYGVGPVVFVNVLDPARHKKSFADQALDVEKNQAVLTLDGVLMDTVRVKVGETELQPDTDYILSRDGEHIRITLIGEKASSSVAVLSVSGDQLDTGKVTDFDVIGGYDEDTGAESGIELVRQIYPLFGMPPGLLIAPGFSHHKAVGAVLQAKCEGINGCFRCETVLDLDTETCRKISEVCEVKKTAGYSDRHANVVWPMGMRDGLPVYGSAIVAAATMATDADNGDIPNVSPSNKEARIDAAVLADGTEVLNDYARANEVNAAGVTTFLNADGWKVWGNYSAAYPQKSAMNAKFWNIRRFFTWHGNNFIMNNLPRIDSTANPKLLESICDEENIRCNGYVAAGVCASAGIEFRAEDNTNETLLEGKLVFRQKLGVYPPAQTIVNSLEYDLDAVREALVSA